MLIVTLPEVYREDLCRKIISHPLVDGVRYNTGYVTPFSCKETLQRVLGIVNEYNKVLWIDLKCRQLRIAQWAVPQYGKIVLNHEIEVDCPARIYFRGNEWSEVKVVRGNVIFIDPPPYSAVGEGQAVNIHGTNLKIKEGFLTEQDREYLFAAIDLGIDRFMLSFVESIDDIKEVRSIIETYKKYRFGKEEYRLNQLVLKVESLRGLEFVENVFSLKGLEVFEECLLMAARDDLMVNIGENKAVMFSALQQIIDKDANAILASRIFLGLEGGGSVAMADYSDLRLMQLMGYKNFMLSDKISQQYFDEAIKVWEEIMLSSFS